MRHLILLAVASLLAGVAQAQTTTNEGEEKHTLLSNSPLTGGAVSFTGKGGLIASQEALWLGGEVYTIFDHNLSLGVAGYGLVNTVNSVNSDPDGKQLYFQSGYGGLFIEPAIFENSVLNISFPVLLGAGGIAETRVGGVIGEIDDFEIVESDFYTSDLFWVVEPGASMNLNISRWMKLSAGVTYRYAYDVELPQTKSTVLDGFNGNVSLKLGWF